MWESYWETLKFLHIVCTPLVQMSSNVLYNFTENNPYIKKKLLEYEKIIIITNNLIDYKIF